MTEAERAKWDAARAHVKCALHLLAALDAQTDGQQQFAACVLASETAHILKAISRLTELKPRPTEAVAHDDGSHMNRANPTAICTEGCKTSLLAELRAAEVYTLCGDDLVGGELECPNCGKKSLELIQ